MADFNIETLDSAVTSFRGFYQLKNLTRERISYLFTQKFYFNYRNWN